jgi:hypothetical protein
VNNAELTRPSLFSFAGLFQKFGLSRMADDTGAVAVSKQRARMALGIAALADLIQLPVNLTFFASAATGIGLAADVPIEALDTAIDIATAVIVNKLLGFHWSLLPTCVLEMVPGLDALPTWTACVAYVAWRRKRENDPQTTPAAIRTYDVRTGSVRR